MSTELETRAARRWTVGRLLEVFGPLLALFVLVGVTTIFNRRFLLPENLLNVLEDLSFRGVVAIGMTFVIILGGIDLSVGSLVAFAGGLGIWLMNTVINAAPILKAAAEAQQFQMEAPYSAVRVWLAHLFSAVGMGGSQAWGVLIAFAAILAAGLAAGLLNGVLIAKGRIAPFIATLGGLAAYRSLALALADGGEFRSASADLFKGLGTGGIRLPYLANQYGNPLVLRWPVLIFFACVVAAWVVLSRTRYGRYVYAIGSNERAALYSAIPVDRIKIATYGLIGLLTGVAAMMNASRMNSVSSGQTGSMWELDAIAAVVIGGTRMTGGAGGVWGTLVGLLILGVIGNMLNLLQVSPYLQGLVKGLIIVAAVLLQRGRRAEQ
jgi:ribose transport system permease protein